MHIKQCLTTIIAVWVIIISCDRSKKFDKPYLDLSAKRAKLISYPYGQPKYSKVNYYRWKSLPEELQDSARTKSYILMKLAVEDASNIINEIVSNRNIDKNEITERTDSVFKSIGNEPHSFIVEQLIADRMISLVFPGYRHIDSLIKYESYEITESDAQILLFATKTLVKNGNPNADLISFCLQHLKNHNIDSTIVELSESSLNNSRDWFGDSVVCSECEILSSPIDKKSLLRRGYSRLLKLKQH